MKLNPNLAGGLKLIGLLGVLLCLVGATFRISRGRLLLVLELLAALGLLAAPLLAGQAGPALLGLAWLLLVAAGLGRLVMARLAPGPQLAADERLVLGTILGLGILMACGLVLGLLHHPAGIEKSGRINLPGLVRNIQL